MKKKIINFFDFWLSDFKWYRNLTEFKDTEWMSIEDNSEVGNSKKWERHPKGTYMLMIVLNHLFQNEDFQKLSEEEQRKVIEHHTNAVKYATDQK
jgi:hypothetical protein